MPERALAQRPAGDDGAFPTVVDAIVEAITVRIADGRYPPGYRLVEPDLIADFAVSRNSLREALRKLHGEGLLELKPHRSAVVRRMSRADVLQIHQVRFAIEGFGARLAAERIQERGNRESLTDQWHQLEVAWSTQDLLGCIEESRCFHQLLLQVAGNALMLRVLTQLQMPAFRVQFRLFVDEEYQESVHEVHRTIVRAVLDGRADDAEQAMRAHMSTAMQKFQALPDAAFGLPVRPKRTAKPRRQGRNREVRDA